MPNWRTQTRTWNAKTGTGSGNSLMQGDGGITKEEIQQLVAPIAKAHGLNRVYLFGSYAMGNAGGSSAVGLLVETTKPFLETQTNRLRDELSKVLHKNVDLVHMDCFLLDEPTDSVFLAHERERYRNAVAKERILIYEKT